MALPPGYNVLPRLGDPNEESELRTVHRKISKSYGITLNLIEREIWEDVSGRINNTKYARNCLKEHPEFNGIIEGIVQVNPWFLKRDSKIKVQVICRFTYYGSDIDRFDFENDYDVYTKEIDLLPNDCEREDLQCLKKPPGNIHSYSKKLRALYNKYGGPIGTKYEREEWVDVNGANEPFRQRRHVHTCLRRTDCLNLTDTPKDPYVFINMPFRFDIKCLPDSTILKHDPKVDGLGHRDPPGREQLTFEAKHGFRQDFFPVDGISSTESEDEECYHRHPGEIRKRKHKNLKREIIRTDQRDLTHVDSYPWFKRQKQPKPHGIRWFVKVYVQELGALDEIPKHTSILNIRKQSYSPLMILFKEIVPKTIYTDYCMAKVPTVGHDTGVISLVGRTDRKAYSLGDDVHVEIKIHNRSTRLVQRIVVEVVQKMQIKYSSGRLYRNIVCRRVCDSEKDDKYLPILPGTQNILIGTVLHPWPTLAQANHMKCNLHKFEPTLRAQEIESWHLKMNKTTDPFSHLAEMPLPRHHFVPPPTFFYRHLSMSTVDDHMKRFLNDMEEPDPPKPVSPCVWNGDPFPSCICGKQSNSKVMRNTHFPPTVPYAYYNEHMDIEKHHLDVDREYMRDYEKFHEHQIFCRKRFPVYVSYEVVIHAELGPQPIYEKFHDQKFHELNKSINDPQHDPELNCYQRGLLGPKLVLPVVYLHQQPKAKIPVPVNNFRVQQRQFHKNTSFPNREMWEPSLGRGSFASKPNIMATCPRLTLDR